MCLESTTNNRYFGGLFTDEPLPKDGWVEVPTKPGFGMTLKRDNLKRPCVYVLSFCNLFFCVLRARIIFLLVIVITTCRSPCLFIFLNLILYFLGEPEPFHRKLLFVLL